MRHFHPRTPEGVKWEQDVRFFEGMVRGCEGGEKGGGGRIWVVVDGESRRIVGFSKWDYPHTLTREEAEEKKRKMMEDRLKRVVEGSNEGLMRDFFEQLARGRERWVKPERTFCEFGIFFFSGVGLLGGGVVLCVGWWFGVKGCIGCVLRCCCCFSAGDGCL